MVVLCSGEGQFDMGTNSYDPTSGVYDATKWIAIGNLLFQCSGNAAQTITIMTLKKTIHKKESQGVAFAKRFSLTQTII